MLLRFLFLTVLAWFVWRLLDRVFDHRATRTAPKPGAGALPAETPVRCERCGVQVPASQVAAIRANCKTCHGEPG